LSIFYGYPGFKEAEVATMIKLNFLTDDIHRLQNLVNTHPHHFVRRKALALLLKSKGLPHHKICETVDICGNTFHKYCKGYQDKCIEFVEEINFYKPESCLKTFEQVIRDYFQKSPPTSIKQACSEIADLTGVYLKPTQMRSYVKKLGAGYRKVCGIPAKVDVEKQRLFKEQELDPKLEEAKAGKRTVYFVDAAHFVLGAFLGFLWSLSRILVKTPSGRQRFNVLGALNAITKELLTVTNDTYITSIQVCELLKIIAQNSVNPITVVLDNAKYQRCKLVMNLAKELGIELLFLPPYSPNLNLIERVWKFVKKQCLNSLYYPDFASFREAISSFVNQMHETHKNELRSLLALNFQLFDQDQVKRAA
jgi:transposase